MSETPVVDQLKALNELPDELRKVVKEALADAYRLDVLQALTEDAQYTGKVIMRQSTTGRGWRLHETSKEGANSDVRKAIDDFIQSKRGSDNAVA